MFNYVQIPTSLTATLLIAVSWRRENLPAVLPQPHRAVRAAEEARPGCSVPDSPLPRQNPAQVRPTNRTYQPLSRRVADKVTSRAAPSLFVLLSPSQRQSALAADKKAETLADFTDSPRHRPFERLNSRPCDRFLSSGGLP